METEKERQRKKWQNKEKMVVFKTQNNSQNRLSVLSESTSHRNIEENHEMERERQKKSTDPRARAHLRLNGFAGYCLH